MQQDHHCSLVFMGEEWRIESVDWKCQRIYLRRFAVADYPETYYWDRCVLDISKVRWPEYCAAALAFDLVT